jgi:aminoglycoside phosphotransferase (APT) family kinase protein
MRPQISVDELLSQAAVLLGQSFQEWSQPDAGADHVIVLVTTSSGQRLVIKAGAEADVDAFVLTLLADQPVMAPALIAQAPLIGQPEGGSLIVLTEVEGRLLADVDRQPERYLRPLIEEMQKVHALTTTLGAGPVLAVERGSRSSWSEYLVAVLTGRDPEFRWVEIARHPGIHGRLLERALAATTAKAQAMTFPPPLSLLHGDLNPYNVFVGDGEIAGIIDWSYARYGDPLFDFARLRMNPFVRANPSAMREYRSVLNLTHEETTREAFYYCVNLLEYVNWYFLQGELAQVQEQISLIKAELDRGEAAPFGPPTRNGGN